MRHGFQLAGITLLWLVGLNIDWDCLVPHCIMGSRDQWEFPLFGGPQWQSLCTALTVPLVLCKGTVKESSGSGRSSSSRCYGNISHVKICTWFSSILFITKQHLFKHKIHGYILDYRNNATSLPYPKMYLILYKLEIIADKLIIVIQVPRMMQSFILLSCFTDTNIENTSDLWKQKYCL